QHQQLRREATRRHRGAVVERGVLLGELVPAVADIRDRGLRLAREATDDLRPFAGGVEGLVDAADLDRLVDHAPDLDAANANGEWRAALQRRDAARTIGAGGRLHDGDRADLLPLQPRLVDEQID